MPTPFNSDGVGAPASGGGDGRVEPAFTLTAAALGGAVPLPETLRTLLDAAHARPVKGRSGVGAGFLTRVVVQGANNGGVSATDPLQMTVTSCPQEFSIKLAGEAQRIRSQSFRPWRVRPAARRRRIAGGGNRRTPVGRMQGA